MIELPILSTYSDRTMVASAHRVLSLAERLAATLRLPADLPRNGSRTMQLTSWFLDFEEAPHTLIGRTGRWTQDLPAALYTAMYLRAAQYCLQQGRPLSYC
ncbi:hypothetical protein ACFYS8_03840 [Kitasatospora sp. NPDC004615]|uniref:hypothetical protein n=1 Tax=Kitasatospora sp. NPDC004615 TaxID=3364017 RepID=UPI003673B6CD